MTTQNIILGQGTPSPLKGMLTLPDDLSAPVPAVVLVHGSGSSNMDEKLNQLTPFKDIAEGLAKLGIATLRYDKRSFTYGLKMVMSKTVITVKEETTEDAILAGQLLKATPGIDPEKVFLLGHSMGGMLAPRIDAEGGDFRGLILLAGSPRKLEEILLEQLAKIGEESGRLVQKILAGQIRKYEKTFHGLYDLTDEEAKARKFGGGTTLYYFKEMGEHAPESYLKELTKPILVLQGGKDFQVRADVDYAAYQQILSGHPNATFRLYPELNHLFMNSVYGKISQSKEEYRVKQTLNPQVIADIAAWIHENK